MTSNLPQDVSALNKQRLSDRILYALALAIEQEDVKTADALAKAMELSMTRNSGGGQFVERREYPKYIEDMMTRLKALKKQYGY
jgi:uncharacterized protein involved in type VI secretion and phage assembly